MIDDAMLTGLNFDAPVDLWGAVAALCLIAIINILAYNLPNPTPPERR